MFSRRIARGDRRGVRAGGRGRPPEHVSGVGEPPRSRTGDAADIAVARALALQAVMSRHVGRCRARRRAARSARSASRDCRRGRADGARACRSWSCRTSSPSPRSWSTAAEMRDGVAGCHSRLDFPERDDGDWRGTARCAEAQGTGRCRRGSGGPREPMFQRARQPRDRRARARRGPRRRARVAGSSTRRPGLPDVLARDVTSGSLVPPRRRVRRAHRRSPADGVVCGLPVAEQV